MKTDLASINHDIDEVAADTLSAEPAPLDLATFAAARGVKHFLVSFSDLLGTMRAKLVPAQAIAEACRSGAGFAGFATWLDMTPADPDMFAIPDPSTAVQLPWKPEVAWVAADLWMNDSPVAQAPRQVLKTTLARARELGYELCTGAKSCGGRADQRPRPFPPTSRGSNPRKSVGHQVFAGPSHGGPASYRATRRCG